MITEGEEAAVEQQPQSADESLTAISVKKRVSIVWKYFEKLDRFRVRCRLCYHEQNYQGTTGNILRHLRNKHNIDATLKGQQNIKEENEYEVVVKMETSRPKRSKRQRKVLSYCEADIDDAYGGTAVFDDYDSRGRAAKPEGQKTTQKGKHSVEEERVMAEIDYFREKAAYYRMQKNLTALQAKKVKYELEQQT